MANSNPAQHDDEGWEDVSDESDWKDVSHTPARPKATMTESALRGAAQGATFGLADEGAGVVGAVTDAVKGPKSLKDLSIQDLVGLYQKNRNESRAEYEKARKDNPGSFTAGELGGGVASAFVPGLGALNVAREAKIGAQLGKAALSGGLAGYGTSNQENLGGQIEDTLVGAGAGAVTHGALTGAGSILKSITPTNVAKKAANIVLNTPEEVTQTYIENAAGVRSAPLRHELAGEYETLLDKLKKETIEGSQASRKILTDEGKQIPGTDIAAIMHKKADELASRAEGVWDNPQELAAYKWLKDNAAKYEAPVASEAGEIPRQLSTNRVKDTLRSIDNTMQHETAPGAFTPVDSQVKGDVRSQIDELLKGNSDAYREQMKSVAYDADLLEKARDIGKSKASLANLFRRVHTDQYGAGQIPRDTLEAFGKRMNSDILEKSRLSAAREAFDKSITNGSRAVNLGSKLFDKLPWGLDKLGPLAGAAVDKYGRPMTQSAVDATVKLNEFLQRGDIQGYVKAAKSLQSAVANGDPAARLTFQLLSQSNPKALKYLKKDDEE